MSARIAAESNIASYAVDLAAALGSRAVFTLTGGMAMYLNRAVATHPDLRVIYNQHEQACVAAAEGYAKAMDFQVPGLAVVTSGPGVTNTITSLCSAYGDSAPLIVLAGQVKTDDIDRYGCRTHGAQEVRSEALISPCVKRFLRLTPDGFKVQLREIFTEALTGRPGPVFVEIPLNVQNVQVLYSAEDLDLEVVAIRKVLEEQKTDPSHVEALRESLAWLLDGQRPLVYVGNGCRIAGVAHVVRAFLQAHQLPAVFSWVSQDIAPASHALNFGAPGGMAPISANQILGEADRILFLGARLDLGTTAFQRVEFGGQAERRFVDIDPFELAKFEHLENSHRVMANLSALEMAADEASYVCGDSTWLDWCVRLRDAYLEDERQRLKTPDLNVYGLARCLSNWSTGKTVVPTASGQAIETFLRFFAAPNDGRCFFGGSLGSMGLGLSQAIGAAFANDRQVICIEADGGLMLNLQELATLSHNAPQGFVLFVINNNGYASIRSSQMRHFGSVGGADRESGVFIPDYERAAAIFHLRYERVENLDDLLELLPTLTREAEPIFVELMIAETESRGPTLKTIIADDGKIMTTPFAELQW